MIRSRQTLFFDAGREGSRLVLNPLSGGMDIVDSRAAALLQHPDDPQAWTEFQDFFAYARQKSYVYDSPEDEERDLLNFRQKAIAAYKAEPFRADIYPTFLCNLRCTYCFQPHLFHGRNNLIQPDVIDALFEALAEFRRRWGSPQPPVLTLFGGEPLLNRQSQYEAVENILRLSASLGYRLKIITNGVELARYAELLTRYDLEFIQVTLDGPQEVHDHRRIFANGEGTFDRIVEGIDKALQSRLSIAIRVNIDRENVPLLPDLADFIIHKGWLEKGANVWVAPVEDFTPETEWCAEQTTIDTLKRLLEIKRQYPQTAFMSITGRLAQFFDYVLEHGQLPLPMLKYCPAVIGNQVSLDYQGNIFACC